jgi:hypothetical protein
MKLQDFDNDEEKVIQDKLKQKTWNEIRTNDSWAILKLCLNLLMVMKPWHESGLA